MERECLLSVFLWHAGVHSISPVCLFRTGSFPQAYRWGGNWAYLSGKHSCEWTTIMIRPSLILQSRKRTSLTPRIQGCIRRSWKSLAFPCVKVTPLCWKEPYRDQRFRNHLKNRKKALWADRRIQTITGRLVSARVRNIRNMNSAIRYPSSVLLQVSFLKPCPSTMNMTVIP